MIFTKKQIMDYIDRYYDDDDEFDMRDVLEDMERSHQELIDELEERQHNSGFYAFQDLIEMYRNER